MRRIYQWLAIGTMLIVSGTPALAADAANGQQLYTNICSACHGFKPLHDPYGVMIGANNAATIQYNIANQVSMMPLSYLKASDIADVAAYLGTLIIVPQTGYWWNPAQGGRGFTIEQNSTSGNIFFAGYLYTGSGGPTWYAAGPMTVIGPNFSAPLASFSGGQTLTGSYKAPSQDPTSLGLVNLSLTDSSHGTLTWPGGLTPIQRYEFVPGGLASPPDATEPQSGYWWNPAEGGRGYTIEVQNHVLFIAAYMYDTSGNPLWYASGPAALMANNIYLGNWNLYSGGSSLTGVYMAPTGAAAAGSLTVQFTSPIAGVLTLPDGRQIPIERYIF